MVDHSKKKLGKRPRKFDHRTLKLQKYLIAGVLPPAPKAYQWDGSLSAWGMMQNDTIGDCTCAAAGHLEMAWTEDNNDLFTPTDQEIVAAYSAITGYVPGNAATDVGAACLDVLNYWRNSGIAGHQIIAYTSIEPWQQNFLKDATYLFGGLYIGLGLPISAQTMTDWDITKSSDVTGNGVPYSWGGHCVPVIGYDQEWVYVITWGQVMRMSWRFQIAYCDEFYAVISNDFLKDGVAPTGFNLSALQNDLAAI
jgi:hypothetical protein